MAYHLLVLEPGKKRARLYAGDGRTTGNLIHAKQYPEAKKAELEDWVTELTRDNPGYTFTLRKVPQAQNIVDN